MKRIWIDGYEANVQQRLGSGQVAFELIKNIEILDHKNEYTILLPDKPLDDLPKEREGFKYRVCKPKKLWTRIALPLALFLSRKKPDVFFSPTHYIPRFSPVSRVGMIFDLAYLHFPESFLKKDLWQLKNWSKFSIETSDHIITISQSTKKDILTNYQIQKEKVTVCYPGYDSKIFHQITDRKKIKRVLNKYGILDNYIIYIGTLQPRKNLVRLFEAAARIEEIKLVVVGKTSGQGKEGWMYDDILEAPKNLGIEDRVIFTGYVPSQDLPYLLSAAHAFILPSLWEGFGIPALEAMACGVPVLVSNVSSLPELVGKTGLTFDPYNIDQIEQAIRLVWSDKNLRAKISKMGFERAKKFSWKKMARSVVRTLEVI